MDNSWENYEPAPMEHFHGLLMNKFHEWRRTKTDDTTVEINGVDLNNIIASAKTETYKKYEELGYKDIRNAIPKTELPINKAPDTWVSADIEPENFDSEYWGQYYFGEVTMNGETSHYFPIKHLNSQWFFVENNKPIPKTMKVIRYKPITQ